MNQSLVESRVSQAFQAGENFENIPQDGNVLDNKCVKFLGNTGCEDCVFYQNPESYARTPEAEARICAHQNVLTVLSENELMPAETLIVGVTGDKIGFYDQASAEGLIDEHKFGWGMIKGHNAFFAHKSELKSFGARLADCSFLMVSAELEDGDTMFGFVHMTRSNIQGDTALSYGLNGDQSYVQAALSEAAEYYGVAIDKMYLTQVAKIDQLDYTFKPVRSKETGELVLTAEQNMDKLFAGWYDQDLLHNTTNPEWKRGDSINENDLWVADYQVMTEHVIRSSGVAIENIDISQVINPGDVKSGHASNAAANDPKRPKDRKRPDARDLYLVTAKEAS